MSIHMEYTEIVGWDIGEKLVTLPSYSRVYTTQKLGRIWELCATDIDMIPRGLKGIDAIHLNPKKGPVFIAPDFNGKVLYYDQEINIKEMTPEQITLGKQRYVQYQSFVESPRYLRRKSDFGPFSYTLSESTLPNNMHFYEKEGKTYLDLTQTNVDRVLNIDGVDNVILPVGHQEETDRNSKMMLDLYRSSRQYE